MSINVGDRVKVKSNHHFRGGQTGIVREYDESAEICHWLIEFSKPGYGYKDKRFKGICLRLDEASLEPVS